MSPLRTCAPASRGVDSLVQSLLRMPDPSATTDQTSRVLLSIGSLVGQEVNLDEFLHAVVDRIAISMQADRGTLYLVDVASGELFSRAAHLPELKQIRLKLGQGVAGYVAQTGEAVNIPLAHSERRFHPDIDKITGYHTTSLLAVPLIDAGGDVFGVLQMLNRRGANHFDQADERLLSELAGQVSQALQATSLYTELRRVRHAPAQPVGYFFNRVIGESPAMRALYKVVQKAAPTDATVLLRGESGTGKELFARAVHVNSGRRAQPFVKVDCAALPGTIIENELFGHERGAFTGADERAQGKFEAADGGTVFIDELGELGLSVQSRLLRVLQDREFERVGGTTTVAVDVRIVAATNRDLAQLVREGKFREDLYYRVKVVELVLPPLRERGDDVERLARHFVAAAARRHRLRAEPDLTGPALERLRAWHWPGNVRELENCIESAVVMCDGVIHPEHLPLPEAGRTTLTPLPSPGSPGHHPPGLTLSEVERRYILSTLERAHGNRTQAAKWLGIGRNTLARKLRSFGLPDR